jgi:hypothetical protein
MSSNAHEGHNVTVMVVRRNGREEAEVRCETCNVVIG